MAVWRLQCSGNISTSYTLSCAEMFVGRDDDCDITIKHKGIDIRHAVLKFDQRLGVFRLTDLGSSNGTFINDECVGEESVPLYVGTRILFGRNPTLFTVEIGESRNFQYRNDSYSLEYTQTIQPPATPSLYNNNNNNSFYSSAYHLPSQHRYYSPPQPSTSSLPPHLYLPVSQNTQLNYKSNKSYFGDPITYSSLPVNVLCDNTSPINLQSANTQNDSFTPYTQISQSITKLPSSEQRHEFKKDDKHISFGNEFLKNKISFGQETYSNSNQQNFNTNSDNLMRSSDRVSDSAKPYELPSWWGDGSNYNQHRMSPMGDTQKTSTLPFYTYATTAPLNLQFINTTTPTSSTTNTITAATILNNNNNNNNNNNINISCNTDNNVTTHSSYYTYNSAMDKPSVEGRDGSNHDDVVEMNYEDVSTDSQKIQALSHSFKRSNSYEILKEDLNISISRPVIDSEIIPTSISVTTSTSSYTTSCFTRSQAALQSYQMDECFNINNNDNNKNNNNNNKSDDNNIDYQLAISKKSEMFVIKFDEDKTSKISKYEPLPATPHKNKPTVSTPNKNEKILANIMSERPKYKLAFKPAIDNMENNAASSIESTDNKAIDDDTDTELQFTTPIGNPRDQTNSMLSDDAGLGGADIGCPLTSSTPISMTSSGGDEISQLEGEMIKLNLDHVMARSDHYDVNTSSEKDIKSEANMQKHISTNRELNNGDIDNNNNNNNSNNNSNNNNNNNNNRRFNRKINNSKSNNDVTKMEKSLVRRDNSTKRGTQRKHWSTPALGTQHEISCSEEVLDKLKSISERINCKVTQTTSHLKSVVHTAALESGIGEEIIADKHQSKSIKDNKLAKQPSNNKYIIDVINVLQQTEANVDYLSSVLTSIKGEDINNLLKYRHTEHTSEYDTPDNSSPEHPTKNFQNVSFDFELHSQSSQHNAPFMAETNTQSTSNQLNTISESTGLDTT